MNTGLPRHATVSRWPTWTGDRSTSVVDSASVSRAGFRLSMNGQIVDGGADGAERAGGQDQEIAPRLAVMGLAKPASAPHRPSKTLVNPPPIRPAATAAGKLYR